MHILAPYFDGGIFGYVNADDETFYAEEMAVEKDGVKEPILKAYDAAQTT